MNGKIKETIQENNLDKVVTHLGFINDILATRTKEESGNYYVKKFKIDAKENLTLQDGSRACYLNIVDKKSGAVLASHCFGKKNINQVKETVVRDALIDSFQNWGKPKSIRVDNGHPLGDPQRKSISTIGLWIIACGIDLI